MTLYESTIEEAAIGWLRAMGYACLQGPALTDEAHPERTTTQQVLLEPRLRRSLERINPELPEQAIDEAMRQLRSLDSRNLAENNQKFHQMLTDGIKVQVRRNNQIRGETVWLVDFRDPDRNDWLVVNQMSVLGLKLRRPDLVVYLNGLPIAVIELKDPTNPQATLQGAHRQLETYKGDIPALFSTNEILVVADGVSARVGNLTAPWERFAPWRTIEGPDPEPESTPQLEVVLRGLFERRRLLDYLRFFVLFETGDGIVKKSAAYHQFVAVNASIARLILAAGEGGDRRAGVVWHTQGSGKSLSMAYFAARVIAAPEMGNPTIVVVTDRNDLDDQLFNQFAAAKDLLPAPAQAESRAELRERLRVASGGIVFSTMQKFSLTEEEKARGTPFPCLTDRRNVIVIVDEAHRTQYGFGRSVSKDGHLSTGFAANLRAALPNASFIGFTGTPIELADRNTPAIFGEYVDIYSISRAVSDGSTVPIHYEARLAKLDLPDDEKPNVDEQFEDATEAEDAATKVALQRKWSRLEALVGTPKRLRLVARDILEHFRRRQEILAGKAMIVCMSRQIAAQLYQQIIRIRPEWHSKDDQRGAVKVVMTGGPDDEPLLQAHVRSKEGLRTVEGRFKDPKDPLQIVIVVDMWLTGFDVPCAHTMYMDKPLRGHTLMQAIARVNRVWKDKASGLVVDYLGVAAELKEAVRWYDRGQTREERAGIPVEEALAALKKHVGIVRDMFHGFDFAGFFTKDAPSRVRTLTAGANHILTLRDGGRRYREAMASLDKAASIALHLEGARQFLDEIAFFQAVHATLTKRTTPKGAGSSGELDAAIRQIVSRAVVSGEVVDILEAAGVGKPDLSILSEDFLAAVVQSPYKNLQVETLNKLFRDEIAALRTRNVVQARRFSDKLEEALTRYHNRAADAAEVILQLVALAREVREELARGTALGLSDDELAFYDALSNQDGVREIMGDSSLSDIARQLVQSIRNTVTIDWTEKEAVRAKMRTQIKRLLRKNGYPPDQTEGAVLTVIEQAEAVCRDWAITPAAAAPPAPVAATPAMAAEPAPIPYVPETPAPKEMDGLWAETMRLADPSLHGVLRAAFDEDLVAPEPGYEWMPGKRVLATLELAWPSGRVAVVLPEQLSPPLREQLAAANWTVFSWPFEVGALLKAIR